MSLLFNSRMHFMPWAFFSFLFVLFPVDVQAQLKDQGYSLSVEPTYGNRILYFKGNFSERFKDSIQKADRGRDAIGASFLFSFKTGKKQRMYTGLQFHNLGFTRKKDNLRFMDTIHPEIGIMNDLSQTGGSYVDFNYRYMYLSLPLYFSVKMSPEKMKSTRIHFIYGGSVSLMFKHDVRAVLHGFSTRGGQKVHILKDAESEADRINANAGAGFRIESLLYGKETWIFVQPEIILPILSANRSNQRQHLWALGLQIGIYYQPDKTD